MHIYHWNSFSCNNSSDYRLIAKFDSPKKARAKAKELWAVLQKHADEYDELSEEEDFSWPGPPTPTLERFGKKYGHEIREFLIWGEEGLNDDMPSVGTVDNDLVLFHGYSSGGFGPDIPRILEKAGASDVDVYDGMPLIYAEFTLRKGCEEFADGLAAYTEQQEEDLSEWELGPPWTSDGEQKGQLDEVAFARLPKGRCKFVLPVNPGDMESMSAALKENATKLVVRLASKEDLMAVLDEQLESAEEEDEQNTEMEGFDATGLSFLFTGKLSSMSRAEANARTLKLSATVAKSVTKSLDVLVVGDEGSPLFGGGKKGTKMLKAESLNKAGASIRIIAERDFLRLVSGGVSTGGELLPATSDFVPVENIPRKKPILEQASVPALKGWSSAIEGFAENKGTIYALGGGGSNVFLISTDQGKSFKSKPVKEGRGLRGMLFEAEKTVWICGESGILLRSSDGGKKFTKVDVGTRDCLFTLFRDSGGTLWCSAEHCLVRSTDDGKTWGRVGGIAGGVWYATQCHLGVLLPTTKGGLYIANVGKVKKTGLKTKAVLYSAVLSPKGSLIVVGAKGTIFRSDDGGKKFSVSKAPLKSDLYRIAALSDGRLIATGASGALLCSLDDGVSFTKLKHKFGKDDLWAAQGFGDSLFIGGDGAIARLQSDDAANSKSAKATKTKSAKATKPKSAKATKSTSVLKSEGATFLFTGKLASMSRSEAGVKAVALGGTLAKSVTKALGVLVIGDEGSPLFGGGKKGSKLLKAEALNADGASIQIISETEFLTLLG